MEFSFETIVQAGVLFIFFLFWLMVFFTFYHFTRFGIGLLPKRLSALFLIGAVGLFSVSVLFYTHIDLSILRQIHLYD